MLTKRKLIPTNSIVDTMYDKFILPNRKFNRKNHEDYFNGKLSKTDVDMIKCLLYLNVKVKTIANIFNVHKTTIVNIKSEYSFSNYVSPFEDKERFGFKVVDTFRLKDWVEQNIDEINEIKLRIEQENSIGS